MAGPKIKLVPNSEPVFSLIRSSNTQSWKLYTSDWADDVSVVSLETGSWLVSVLGSSVFSVYNVHVGPPTRRRIANVKSVAVVIATNLSIIK